MSSISKYTIKDGDTLQMISQKLLGDTSKWAEIAILNDLAYPFITDRENVTPETRTYGDQILIPGFISDSDVIVETDTVDDSFFGIDLLLTSDKQNISFGGAGDFEADIYGDLKVATGRDCLKQDLMHRLLTEVGTLPYHPEYGSTFLKFIGKKGDPNWKDKAIVELVRTFRSDYRVSDIKNIQMSVIETGIEISCDIVTVSNIAKLKEAISL